MWLEFYVWPLDVTAHSVLTPKRPLKESFIKWRQSTILKCPLRCRNIQQLFLKQIYQAEEPDYIQLVAIFSLLTQFSLCF